MSSRLAVLIYGLRWELSQPSVVVNRDFSLWATAKSPLASKPIVLDGWGTMLVFDPVPNDIGYGGFSELDSALTLLTIALGSPCWQTWWVFIDEQWNVINADSNRYAGGLEVIEALGDDSALTAENVDTFTKSCANRDRFWAGTRRVGDALMFFHFAYAAPVLDLFAVNLATAIELLFAPHEHGETTHQIGHHVALFMSNEAAERADVYHQFKVMYGLRSKVIHGGLPGIDKIGSASLDSMAFVVRILRRVVQDRDLVIALNDNKQRRQFLDALVFGAR